MDALIGGSLAALTIYAAAKWNKTDKEKIDHVFKNIDYCLDDKYPRLFKTHKTDASTLYSYHAPYGLIDDAKLQVIEKTLNRPIKITFVNTKLHIRVYKNNLPDSIHYDWQPTNGWTIPIGWTQDGLLIHDFDKIPHMTAAGMTRQGKTVLLKLIMAHLILNHPHDVRFYIIDLKGGLEFGSYEVLKQVKKVASNVNEAKSLLKKIKNNIDSDMKNFKEKGYRNILDTKIRRRTFIIVDESAQLVPGSHLDKDEKKPYNYCLEALAEVARISGALGYRLIYAGQYPTADNMPRQIKQNADAKISFRLPTEVASRVAIDEQGAERLKGKGRAIYRTHEKHVIQVPYIDDSDIEERLCKYVSPTNKETKSLRTDHVEFG